MLSACLVAILFLVQDPPKPLPEAGPFLAELRKTLHTDTMLLSQYTYTEKRTLTFLDSDQKPKKTEVNVFEVFPRSPDRIGYQRQIVKNGKTLTGEELEKSDRALQKKIDSARRRLNDSSPAEREKRRAERLQKEEQVLDDVFGGYDAKLIGREMLLGRPVILVKFTPRPGYKPKTKEGKTMQHVAGTAWVSEDDHQVARVEMEVIDPISIGLGILAKLQKGASIKAERQKFNEEIWLPMKTDITLNARLLFKGFNIRQTVEYSDHKKYSVDTILKFPDQEP
jgi:hypothetical protein